MNTDGSSAQSLIADAMQALKKGDRRAARHLAEQAAALAPQIEQSWLILAYLAGPKAARYYLNQALELNPNSPKVLAALEWLNKRPAPAAPSAPLTFPDAPPAEPTQPIQPVQPAASTAPVGLAGMGRWYRLPLRHWRRVSAGLVIFAIVACFVTLSSAPPQAQNQDATLANLVQTVLNSGPTLESSVTPTLTGTATPTQTTTPSLTPTYTITPTATSTPTLLPTSTATSTHTPTEKPSATPTIQTPVVNTQYTVKPGDSLYLIAQRHEILLQDLVAANNLGASSLILAGQVLTIPSAGQPPAALQPTSRSATAVPSEPSGNGKEIVIDISEQHLYAYQDNNLVFSFVASTGIGNSTRIGVFKVLDKIPKAYSNSFNIWMPYWMGIYYSGTLENGIHGLPLLMNGVELWGNLLGKPATYGCIESKTSEIKQLYDWAEIGTPVIIRR